MERLSHKGLNQFRWFPEFMLSCTNETEFNKDYFSPTHITEYALLLLPTHSGNLLSLFCSVSKKECRLTTNLLKGKVV